MHILGNINLAKAAEISSLKQQFPRHSRGRSSSESRGPCSSPAVHWGKLYNTGGAVQLDHSCTTVLYRLGGCPYQKQHETAYFRIVRVGRRLRHLVPPGLLPAARARHRAQRSAGGAAGEPAGPRRPLRRPCRPRPRLAAAPQRPAPGHARSGRRQGAALPGLRGGRPAQRGARGGAPPRLRPPGRHARGADRQGAALRRPCGRPRPLPQAAVAVRVRPARARARPQRRAGGAAGEPACARAAPRGARAGAPRAGGGGVGDARGGRRQGAPFRRARRGAGPHWALVRAGLWGALGRRRRDRPERAPGGDGRGAAGQVGALCRACCRPRTRLLGDDDTTTSGFYFCYL